MGGKTYELNDGQRVAIGREPTADPNASLLTVDLNVHNPELVKITVKVGDNAPESFNLSDMMRRGLKL